MNAAEKKAFRLVQEIVCQRDRVCQRCGAVPISGHHVFGRRNHATAFDPDSCIALCPPCHDGPARQHPSEIHALLVSKIGIERYTHLAFLSKEVVRLRDADFKAIAIELQEKLGELRER